MRPAKNVVLKEIEFKHGFAIIFFSRQNGNDVPKNLVTFVEADNLVF
jgi:hypothetical protein